MSYCLWLALNSETYHKSHFSILSKEEHLVIYWGSLAKKSLQGMTDVFTTLPGSGHCEIVGLPNYRKFCENPHNGLLFDHGLIVRF